MDKLALVFSVSWVFMFDISDYYFIVSTFYTILDQFEI